MSKLFSSIALAISLVISTCAISPAAAMEFKSKEHQAAVEHAITLLYAHEICKIHIPKEIFFASMDRAMEFDNDVNKLGEFVEQQMYEAVIFLPLMGMTVEDSCRVLIVPFLKQHYNYH